MKIKMYFMPHTYVETGIVGLLINLAWLYWQGRILKTFEEVRIVFPETPRRDVAAIAEDGHAT